MLNPFDDDFGEMSDIIYKIAPMVLIGIIGVFMLFQKALGKSVNIILLLSVFGLMSGMLIYHVVTNDDTSDTKKAGFFGYIGMSIGLIMSAIILISKKSTSVSTSSYTQYK